MPRARHSSLTFDDLSQRLVHNLRQLVHSGEFTERGLASIVGVSQSHLHNVLNGLRTLTPTIADQIMNCLNWSVLDLVETPEAQALLSQRQASRAFGREIPLHGIAIGIGFCLPSEEISTISVPNSWLARAERPFAASAGRDPVMEGVIEAGDILLIDRAPAKLIHEDALYVIRWQGSSLARWLRFSSRGLYLVSAADPDEPLRWPLLVLVPSQRMAVVEGKIIAAAQPPDGTFRPLVPRSASN